MVVIESDKDRLWDPQNKFTCTIAILARLRRRVEHCHRASRDLSPNSHHSISVSGHLNTMIKAGLNGKRINIPHERLLRGLSIINADVKLRVAHTYY